MPDPITVDAYAKLNLGLVVGRRDHDGFHPLTSLVQSVSLADRLVIQLTDEDDFTVTGMAESEENLAWQALQAVRSEVGSDRPVTIALQKSIAVAAGLGGGSADAAAVLAVAARLLGLPEDRLAAVAGALGSDVPFCLIGGLALIQGRGEQITSQEPVGEYAVGIVVPPVELSTRAVYLKWDELDGPAAGAFPTSHLPPGLRSFEPLRNDLQPAAETLAPEVAAWRDELSGRWGRPVAMTGSGPALFAYFLDEDEARAAVADRPAGARSAQAALPVVRGWREVTGTLAGPE